MATPHESISSTILQVICVTCGSPIAKQSVYKCTAGHILCRDCFSELYCEGSEATCSKCRDKKKLLDESQPSDRSLFSDEKVKNSVFNKFLDMIIHDDGSAWNDLKNATSKKPVRCPHDLCKKILAIDFFSSHFENDHSSVPKFDDYEPGTRVDLHFDPLIVNNNTCSCIGLVNTPDGGVLMVMVSRIPCPHDLYEFTCESTTSGSVVQCTCMPSELVILWAWSNVPMNLNYTVAVSNPTTDNRLRFNGPLLTLHQFFEKICIQGSGLVMSHRQMIGFSGNFSRDIRVHAVFWLKDE